MPELKPERPSAPAGWTGQRLARVEDVGLLNGTARFAADYQPVGGALAAAVVRSPYASADITDIADEAALASPGVRAVVVGSDLVATSRPLANIVRADVPLYPLAVDRARYWGEPVALVLADTRAQAEDGGARLRIDYTPREPVIDVAAALNRYAPNVHDGPETNLVHERDFLYGEPEARFATAAHIIGYEATFPRSSAMPLETFVITAEYDSDRNRYTIWSNYGGPLALQTVMAAALRVPVSGLRLIIPDRIGGNFGIKQAMYPYMVLMALAARRSGRPVRWIEDRNEHLVASSAGSERLTRIDGAFDDQGVLLALRIDQVENFGAYIRTPEPAGLYRMHGNLNGPYQVQDIAVRNRGVLTNQVPSGLNRGFGGPQFFHALESMMDVAAHTIGLDRAEIRRRNLVKRDSFPYVCPSGATLDSGDYEGVLERALAHGDYTQAMGTAERARGEGRAVGVGLACSVETSGNNLGYMNLAGDPDSPAAQSAKSGAGATATLAMDAFGGVVVQLDCPDCGQGYRTVAAQIVADELGLAPEDIVVETALDTSVTAWTLTSGNYANRFSTAVASAVALAARRAADKLRVLAAANLEARASDIELVDGLARDRRTGRSDAVRRLAGQLHWDIAGRPESIDGPIRETGVYAPSSLPAPVDNRISTAFTYSFQCDLVVIEIDRRTGALVINSYVSVHDAGTVLNPGLFEGQVRGGLAHGLGAAVREQLAYDADGLPSATDLRCYGPIMAAEMPPVVIDHLCSPSPNTVQGAKGLGDGCAILAPTALTSAVADALQLAVPPTPPFTPARLWHLANPDEARP